MLFQDDQFYYLWKPTGWPSTWGRGDCFLDRMISGEYEEFLQVYHHSQNYDRMLYDYFHEEHVNRDLNPIEDVHALIHYLTNTFSRTQEFGLVNRLDTPTAGFLYFAKNVYVYSHFKKWQKAKRVNKHYLALIYGDIRYVFENPQKYHLHVEGDVLQITYPLMHHRHDEQRMVVLTHAGDEQKGRGHILERISEVRLLDQDEKNNKCLLHISIQQGARHQIRAHLGALGYAIMGEDIYVHRGQPRFEIPLHLWSVGCELDAPEGALEHFYKVWAKMNTPIWLPGDGSRMYPFYKRK